MALTVVHTSTYSVTRFADPYKVCCECGRWITDALVRPGLLTLTPCLHRSDYRDVCPSWGPVDGCCCVEFLADRDHGVPLQGEGIL
jgi:hypothetical protein